MTKSEVEMKKIAFLAAGLMVFATACGDDQIPEDAINNGDSDLHAVINGAEDVEIKCVAMDGFIASWDGIAQPRFMDPLCLGVYRADGVVNDAQFKLYVQYLAAIESGDGELAYDLASQLILAMP